jgi:hypothetical protein
MERLPVALSEVDAQIEAQRRLREIVVRAVQNAWTGLGQYNAPDVARFLAVVVPLIVAAQRYSVTLSDAYVARVLGRHPLGLDPAPILATLRGDTTPQSVYRRPFVTVWSDLAAGSPYEAAVAAGQARAEASAAMDVQLASRAGLQAVQDADPRIRGWERKADPGACPYCRLLDGVKLARADAAATHPRCGCSIVPRTQRTEPDPLPAGVTVWDHGEYGATLGDPAHDHLSEGQALSR